MTGKGVVLVIIAALFTACANLMLREGVVRAGGLSLALNTLGAEIGQLLRQPLFSIGVLLYGAASLVWFRIVSTENLTASYPLLVSFTFLFVTSGAILLFGEPVSRLKLAGLVIILVGIVLTSHS